MLFFYREILLLSYVLTYEKNVAFWTRADLSVALWYIYT